MRTLRPRTQSLNVASAKPHVVERDRGRAFQRARVQFLSDNPLCEYCLAEQPQRYSAATILEHRIPLWQGGPMWDRANWAASCVQCAIDKTRREARERADGGGSNL